MFEDWKKAWQQAVHNFQRELAADEPETVPHVAAMRRDVSQARNALSRLSRELAEARAEAAREREEEQTCIRRKRLAEGIGDEETVTLAASWAERHAQKAAVLERKVEVLSAELELRRSELQQMEAHVAQAAASIGAAASAEAPPRSTQPRSDRMNEDAEFRRLDREARERAAEARLEELKRRAR